MSSTLRPASRIRDPLRQFLEDQGFHKKDVQVYMDVYRHEQSFASSVALRTDIDRTTVYSVLKRLLRRGVIIQTKVKNTKAYMAVSPKVFLDQVDREAELLHNRRRMASLAIEEFLKIKRRDFVKPRTKIYEGTEAIINLYKYTVEHGGEQKSFVTLRRIPENLKNFLRGDFIRLKVQNKVLSKVLVAESPHTAKYQALDSQSNRQTKIIKKHPFDLHSEIVLFHKSEIAIINFGEQSYGLVIDSPALYATLQMLFEYIWMNEA